MLNKSKLKELRDERGFRKSMNAGKEWVTLTCNLYRTEDDMCYYEIEKTVFYYKSNGEPDATFDHIDHGEMAWSTSGFDSLIPKWTRLIAYHKANDYFVDAYDPSEETYDEFWDKISDDGVKYNCSSPE